MSERTNSNPTPLFLQGATGIISVWAFAVSRIRNVYVPYNTTMGAVDDRLFGASALSEAACILQFTFHI